MQGDKGDTGEVGFPGRRVSNFVDIFFRNSTLSCLYLKQYQNVFKKGLNLTTGWYWFN